MTFLHLFMSVIGAITWAAEVHTTRPPVANIYWNQTNQIFKPEDTHYIIDVNMQDSIQFLCPSYEIAREDTDNFEHYIIYRLPKQNFDSCSIPEDASERQLRSLNIEKILNCSSPYEPVFYLSPIDNFIALPGSWGGLKYEPGQSYYFTSISTGQLSGLHNRRAAESSCQRHNMKAEIRVCCESNATFTCPEGSAACSSKSKPSYSTRTTQNSGSNQSLKTTPELVRPPTTKSTPPVPVTTKPPTKVTWTTIRSLVSSTKSTSTAEQSATGGMIGSAHILTLSYTVLLLSSLVTLFSTSLGVS